jgi:hypothetical protein
VARRRGGARKRIVTYSILEPQECQSRSCSLSRLDSLCPPTVPKSENGFVIKKKHEIVGPDLATGHFSYPIGIFLDVLFPPAPRMARANQLDVIFEAWGHGLGPMGIAFDKFDYLLVFFLCPPGLEGR